MGVSRGCPNFLGTPIISGMGKATDFKFGGYNYRADPNKPINNFGEKTAWAYPGTSQTLGVPYYLRNG